MDATGHPDTNFRVMFLAFCINIVTNLVGVHFFGVIGAAIGTATTYFIIFIVTQVILYKKFGVQWLNVFKNTFLLYKEIIFHGRNFMKIKTRPL
jgi:lipopolysaccharide exporter